MLCSLVESYPRKHFTLLFHTCGEMSEMAASGYSKIFSNLEKKFAVQVFYQGQDLGEEVEDSKIWKLNTIFLPRVFRIHPLSHRFEREK